MGKIDRGEMIFHLVVFFVVAVGTVAIAISFLQLTGVYIKATGI